MRACFDAQSYVNTLWQLFDDQDINKDMQLSLEEWNQGGGYLTSDDDER